MSIESVATILLAILGLGFLVFIHELGHYFMARKVGMTVEAFGIGFGKPLYTWERKGVKWHICILPFGGYVRIAGMEKKGVLEPYLIEGGFYSKSPAKRIAVALMGPFVNILFALLCFSFIWSFGGRERPFSEFTHLIGAVDSKSALYRSGVRAGDEIQEINQAPYKGFNDLLLMALLSSEPTMRLQGNQIDYWAGTKLPFSLELEKPKDAEELRTSSLFGITSAAQMLTFQGYVPHSPMQESGIEKGDHLIWADGEIIFSLPQLLQVLRDDKALLTVQRGNTTFLTRIPRLSIADLRLDERERAELSDWQHASLIKGKLSSLRFIPYNLSLDAVVEEPLSYIDESLVLSTYSPAARSSSSIALERGDRILAIDGAPIASASELFAKIQEKHVLTIASRSADKSLPSWKMADSAFMSALDISSLQTLILSIGKKDSLTQSGQLHLLKPVIPRSRAAMLESSMYKEQWLKGIEVKKGEIEKIENPQEKKAAELRLQQEQKSPTLGIHLSELNVRYNPNPFVLFGSSFSETWKTLKALISGALAPKWMAGPVGIVHVMQKEGWSKGILDALYWMAIISLNLGVLNLLPIPVFDGGHICFSLIEMVTKKPIKAKTMERLIVPFVVLLILFLLYITFQDLARLFL